MINFNTDNLIIVAYFPTAGGKFLINSLGLSDDAVFQDAHLAEEQLKGNFSQQDKFNLLTTRLQNTSNSWKDLGLGCYELFGITNEEYYTYSEILTEFKDFNNVIDPLSNSDKKFFLVAHWPSIIEEYLKVWPNAKILGFINSNDFTEFRSDTLKSIWNQYKGDSWPPIPQKISDVPDSVRLELKNKFQVNLDHMEYRSKLAEEYINNNIKKLGDKVLLWDTNWYFDEYQTINGIKKLYQELHLKNFNESLIRSYYHKWIDKLQEIRIT